MTRLLLDFLHPQRRQSRVGIALLVIGVLLVAGAAWRHAALAADVELLRERLANAQSIAGRDRAPLRPLNAADARINAQALAAANQVVASLNKPWSALFAELESVALTGVALLSIQPEGESNRVLIGGEATRYEQVLDYAAGLEATAGFANVLLVSHSRREAAGATPFAFLLSADWVGAP